MARRRAPRGRSQPSRRFVRRRRAPLAAVLVILIAGAALGAWLAFGGDDPEHIGRDGSTAAAGPPVEITREPESYRVVYRLEERFGDDVTVSTDILSVRRPFESRLETRSGPPPGDEQETLRLNAFARLQTGETGVEGGTFVVPPAVAADDVRFRAIVDDVLEAGVERRERREVLGRPCQVYRSLTGLLGRMTAPAADDHVDSCVDESGLVLEHVEVFEGEIASRRIAVEIEEDAPLDDDLFATGEATIPVREGGGGVRRLVPGSRPPGTFWELPSPPAGFEAMGRYSVVPPQPENFGDPARIAFRRAGVADVWVHGPDVLVIDQGGTLQGAAPFEMAPDTPRIDVGALGEAEVVLTGTGAEVRVLLPGGRYVQAYGTLPVEDMVAELGRLVSVAVEGEGTLEFLDPAPDE
jgi:hypothetical protein